MFTRIKLIRHRIPLIHLNGRMSYHLPTFGSPEHQRFLRKKLMEEVEEYLEDRTVAELVDIIEAACALAHVCHGTDVAELEVLANRKRHDRGSFYEPVMLAIEDDA